MLHVLLSLFFLTYPQASVFSLTADEMVFASKLSDENRRKFCYQLSLQERMLILTDKEDLLPDEKVEAFLKKVAQVP